MSASDLAAFAQGDSAPATSMTFYDTYDGNIIVNQVRVPASGEATYTYYESLGWQGAAPGYAGIQAHPNGHNFIFSLWDDPAQSAPIEQVYVGHGTFTQPFGGEGTGLQSLNFDLGWKTDTWVTQVARAWSVGDHTYFGYWVSKQDTGQWYHLATLDVAAANCTFDGHTYAFVEDWSSTGENRREVHIRDGWKRGTDDVWGPFTQSLYTVNPQDIAPGGRAYNYRTHWDAGTASDAGGEYWYMISGGANTTPTTEQPAVFPIARAETEPDFAEIGPALVTARLAAGVLTVDWQTDDTTAPQFAYSIGVYDNPTGSGSPVLTLSDTAPHIRQGVLAAAGLNPQDTYYVHVTLTDIFDRSSDTSVAIVPEPTSLSTMMLAAMIAMQRLRRRVEGRR